MEGVFSAAKKVYNDNFLEYATTGELKYKKAYDAALQSMDRVLDSLTAQINAVPPPQQHADSKKDLQQSLVHQKDKVMEAKLRGVPINLSPSPSMFWRYVTAGVLVCSAVGLASV